MTCCDSIRESIGPWLDGELGPAEAESVRAHLAACAACAEARGRLEKIHLMLKETLSAEAARIDFWSFWRDVQGRVRRRYAWREGFWERCRGLFLTPRPSWAILAIILLLFSFVSVDFYWPGWNSSGVRNSFAVVDSIDAHGRNVALFRKNDTKTTVIWLYEDEEGEHETAEETPKVSPAF